MRATAAAAAAACSAAAKGVVFDIDGVIIRGPRVLPGAVAAIEMLLDADVPFGFCTNGGGMTEEAKAEELSGWLGVRVLPEQVVLAHTPMRRLVGELPASESVLLLGQKNYYGAAMNYGIDQRRVFTAVNLLKEKPELLPLAKSEVKVDQWPRPSDGLPTETIKHIWVYADPRDWLLEAQLCLDVLSAFGESPGVQAATLANSNHDFVYAAASNTPRLAQGAFLDTLAYLWARTYPGAKPLTIDHYGKPYPSTYRAVEEQIFSSGLPAQLFFVGDNPKSDIAGANAAGDCWTSVLLRSGVFDGQRQENDAENPGDVVVDGVLDAVKWILKQ